MTTIDVAGRAVPAMMYGTAWKEDETAELTRLALEAGFRAIDTANQRKHYHEAAVGDAIQQAITSGRVRRDELFLQTKFTHQAGQDHRLPYDPDAPIATQVAQSVASSLEHLGVDAIDSYVLHGPSVRYGLAPEDVAAWRAMEAAHAAGHTRLLGVSNVTREQLEALCDLATVPPALVQNRCYARLGWDREVRAVCRARGLVYQGFSLLTANLRELQHPAFHAIVARTGATPAQVVFRFALALGLQPLTGTSDPDHMREDLAAEAVELTPEELARIEAISG